MGKAYALHLRQRIWRKGRSGRFAGRVFGVSAATVERFGKLAPHLIRLLNILGAEPDITLKAAGCRADRNKRLGVQLSSRHGALEFGVTEEKTG